MTNSRHRSRQGKTKNCQLKFDCPFTICGIFSFHSRLQNRSYSNTLYGNGPNYNILNMSVTKYIKKNHKILH